MNERPTVRLLLLDPDKRILLMKIDDAGKYDDDPALMLPSPRWITLGGGIEDGETVEEAASREAWEESGIEGIMIGPAVWTWDCIRLLHGNPGLYKHTFVVAHAPTCETDFANWTEQEKAVVKELRWWTLKELQRTSEAVWPEWLASRLPDIVARRNPRTVEIIPSD